MNVKLRHHIAERANVKLVWLVAVLENALGLGDSRFPLRFNEAEQTLLAYGPPRHIELVQTVIDTLEERFPKIRDLILQAQVLTPLDIERITGLTEGNIFQGELSLEQLFFNRPVPGWARYRTPIKGLWMCGSATHPGGGIMGAPGKNAAERVLKDARR